MWIQGCRALVASSRITSAYRLVGPTTTTRFPVRCFASAKDFESAKERLNTLKEDPGPDVKLKLYGLFKQATVGQCNAPKPGMLDIVGKAKWSAWNSLGSMSQDDAKKEYVKVVEELVKSSGGDSEESAKSDSQSSSGGKFKELIYEEKDKVTYITMNRPNKMNAITSNMYFEFVDALEMAANNKNYATVITGAGKYFSSGNDLSNLMKVGGGSMKDMAEAAAVMLEKFVDAFIDHPKLLVGLINGPSIGIACTTLGLYDVIYATDTATFHTPFTNLGLTPEGCSSYTFPKRMGAMRANEVLLLGKKMSSAEALECGFITEVFPADSFQQETQRRLQSFAKLMPISLKESKTFIRSVEKEKLHQVNHEECTKLITMWQGEECISAATKFLSRK
ncbi:enoyl-CoA delta isomerase 2-like [Paramacrobiotus metropolitanus]|uniref:enoyl-CoA delta isomerase 2-like n=1 Tax=Paramacrobiotus metropolitanus TaxID=2943436 RepID=UPI002445AE0F|nr:enoyl-CoA delta isomerase 2-like [Paramacrobiotus metropolitanus]